MDRHRPNRIINAQPFQQLRTENNQHSGNSTQNEGANGADPVAWTGDGHEPGKESVHCETNIPFPGSNEGVGQGRQTGSAGCECGVRGYATYAFEIHRGECAAGIESVPTKPKEQSPSRCDRQVMRHHWTSA